MKITLQTLIRLISMMMSIALIDCFLSTIKGAAAEATSNGKTFKTLQARNLYGKRVTIPTDLHERRCCLVVAFQREQQAAVDTWAPFLENLEKNDSQFKYYEVPVIASGYSPVRWLIDGSMAAAIKADEGKKRTLTCYTNASKFAKAMHIDRKNISLFILGDDHQIIGTVSGIYDDKKAQEFNWLLSQ